MKVRKGFVSNWRDYNGKRHGVELEFNKNGTAVYICYYLYGSAATKEEYHRYTLIEQLAGIKGI